MRQVKLLSIEMKNFRSFGSEIVDFGAARSGFKFLGGQNDEEPRLGPNGAGKSTLWEAVCWCWFGRSIRGARTSQVIAWGAKEAEVTVVFSVDGDACMVLRKGPPERIEINGLENCIQGDIQQLIGLTYDQFLHSVMFGQGQKLFPDLKLAERGELFDQVLGLELWNVCSEVAGGWQKDTATKIANRQKDVQFNKGKLSSLPTKADLKKRLDDWVEYHEEELTRSYQALDVWNVEKLRRVEAWKGQIKFWNGARAARAAEALREDGVWCEQSGKRLEALYESLRAAENVRDSLTEPVPPTHIDAATKEKEQELSLQRSLLRRLENKVAVDKTMLSNHERTLREIDNAKVCSSCGQVIQRTEDTSARAAILAVQIEAEKVDLARREAEVQVEDLTLIKQQGELEGLKETQLVTTKDYYEQQNKIDAAKREVARLEREGEQLVAQIDAGSSYSRLAKAIAEETNPFEASLTSEESTINPHAATLEKLQREVNPHIERNEAIENEIDYLEAMVAEVELEINSLEGRNIQLEYWRGAFKRIRLFYVSQVLEALEIEIQAAISVLGLDGWKIKLTPESENKSGTVKLGIQIRVKSRTDQEGEWETWSGGEGQRLRLAMAMGLASLIQRAAGVWFDFEVWDEPSAWLSTEGVDDLLEALQYRAESLQKSIWLIDHRSLAFSGFSETWVVKKTEVGSKVYKLEGASA